MIKKSRKRKKILPSSIWVYHRGHLNTRVQCFDPPILQTQTSLRQPRARTPGSQEPGFHGKREERGNAPRFSWPGTTSTRCQVAWMVHCWVLSTGGMRNTQDFSFPRDEPEFANERHFAPTLSTITAHTFRRSFPPPRGRSCCVSHLNAPLSPTPSATGQPTVRVSRVGDGRCPLVLPRHKAFHTFRVAHPLLTRCYVLLPEPITTVKQVDFRPSCTGK